ncbi:MAG: hypothetical protein K2X66_04370 [Cyanobacteria bacterium]|nr:hypothetical protein [Cyanobacteriota bacterium]
MKNAYKALVPALVLTLGLSGVAAQANTQADNLFGLKEVSANGLLLAHEEKTETKAGEAKEAEHKCAKDKEHKCGKEKSHKCAADKCSKEKAHKCGKEKTHKCAADKCAKEKAH